MTIPQLTPERLRTVLPFRGQVVAQLVEALRYKAEGCVFESR
jgi:hypothetical protein